MALTELLQQLDELTSSAQNAFQSADSEAAIEEARIAFLGKKNGRLKEAQQGLGRVEPQDRKTAGMRFNETKQQLEKALAAAKARLTTEGDSGAAGDFDAPLPGTQVTVGHMHPLSLTIEDL